jgi:hypothetical protein
MYNRYLYTHDHSRSRAFHNTSVLMSSARNCDVKLLLRQSIYRALAYLRHAGVAIHELHNAPVEQKA